MPEPSRSGGRTTREGRLDGLSYDVVVVGGGVVGCAIAWRLARSGAHIAVVEATHDVGEGASKGNTGITTSGADCTPGTLEAELVRASSPRWEALCAALDTPFQRIGTLQVAVTAEEESALAHLRDEAALVGARATIVTGDAAREQEPLISPEARAALHVPDDGIVDPLRLTLGFAELAVRNGADLHLLAPVVGMRHDPTGERIVAVVTSRGAVAAGAVVNAAGLGAGAVSRLANGDDLAIWPRQGQYWLLDRAVGGRFRRIVGGVPTAVTRGVYAVPTTNGSLLVGPTARDHDDPSDRRVDVATLDDVMAQARRLVPSLDPARAIKTFAANRPAADPVYRVGRDGRIANLVQAAGIRSTGVSASPAIADRVRDLLVAAGAPVADDRPAALDRLEPVGRLLDHPRPEELFDRDRRYGQVVCACEQVTAAEIAAACAMAVPPASLDGLRRRTRAAGGRCQGAVCLAGVSFLLSLHTGRRPWELVHGEPGSTIGVAAAAHVRGRR